MFQQKNRHKKFLQISNQRDFKNLKQIQENLKKKSQSQSYFVPFCKERDSMGRLLMDCESEQYKTMPDQQKIKKSLIPKIESQLVFRSFLNKSRPSQKYKKLDNKQKKSNSKMSVRKQVYLNLFHVEKENNNQEKYKYSNQQLCLGRYTFSKTKRQTIISELAERSKQQQQPFIDLNEYYNKKSEKSVYIPNFQQGISKNISKKNQQKLQNNYQGFIQRIDNNDFCILISKIAFF